MKVRKCGARSIRGGDMFVDSPHTCERNKYHRGDHKCTGDLEFLYNDKGKPRKCVFTWPRKRTLYNKILGLL